MGRKYFVWSFDDGLEQDKKIVEILRSFNMGATFNLNWATDAEPFGIAS